MPPPLLGVLTGVTPSGFFFGGFLSYHVLNHAIRDAVLPTNQKAVLWSLESLMSEEQLWAWPSLPTLARMAGMSEATLKRTLLGMRAADLIRAVRKPWRGQLVNHYQINRKLLLTMASGLKLSPPSEGVGSNRQEVGSSCTGGGLKLSPNRITLQNDVIERLPF